MKLVKVTDLNEAPEKKWYDDACGTALGMELVGERWSLLIVRELLLGPRRFGDLRAGLPGISANVLTQRLEGLAAAGIVARAQLPPPARAQVYVLTDWGRECEPVVLGLGRWALRSPRHDPMQHFSPSALMLSLKMLLVAERVGDLTATIGFELRGETYVARVAHGAIVVARDAATGADAMLSGETNAFLPVFYGGMPLTQALDADALYLVGDLALASRFATMFALPEKIT
ncbi:winged helix-turn-helix transcriptional regulator [Sphingomonas endolithica]|uniref:winged helix-turn-helix transcriptional regulator n=1 Tax=Sphingomonas endolithica TaxID=2972485 RepID=UPI0021B061C4|nr:winged helix-turn-helix transcriptional regulator [Sphingomonas sp. ZFBP2030]